MGRTSIRSIWARLDQGEALAHVARVVSLGPRVTIAGSFVARTEGNPLGNAGIAPGSADTPRLFSHVRSISQADDWGIGYG